MASSPRGGQRKGGLGRGLGALIPTSEEERQEANGRPLDVLFPDLQGNGTASKAPEERGGSAKELLSPRVKRELRANVSRETKPQSKNVSRETMPRAPRSAKNVSRETIGETSPELVEVPGASFAFLPLSQIIPNQKQPRQVFEQRELDELADSIEQVGLLQPVVVRPLETEQDDSPARYELIMGERRLRATEQLGKKSIPAIIRRTADEELLRDALLENLHRTDLNPLEEAAAYSQLLADFACTQEELADRIARSRSQIANTLRLLRLPGEVQQLVAAEVLSAGHARSLLGLTRQSEMSALATRIVDEGLSVRATEDLVRRLKGQPEPTPRPRVPTPEPSELALKAAARVSDLLDTQVVVREGKSKGKIVIDFADGEDLQRIVDLLGGTVR